MALLPLRVRGLVTISPRMLDDDSRRDELTGLANRRTFDEVMERESERSRRSGDPLALVIVDIEFGNSPRDHQQSDEVLREVGRILRESCRETDLPARYGGEEFAVVLPSTDPRGAWELAEHTRAQIEALKIGALRGGRPLRLSARLHVTSLPDTP